MSNDKINSISANPDKIQMDINDTQFILIEYDPPNYPNKEGTWVYSTDYVKMIRKTDVLFEFVALKDGYTSIEYIPNDDPSKRTYTDLAIGPNLAISPTEISTWTKKMFNVDIIFDGDYTPSWEYDPKYVSKDEDSSTNHSTVFATLNSTDYEPIKMVCVVGDQHQEFLCTISEPSLELVPSSQTVSIGDYFTLDVSLFATDLTQHSNLVYDESVFQLQGDGKETTLQFLVVSTSEPGTYTIEYMIFSEVAKSQITVIA